MHSPASRGHEGLFGFLHFLFTGFADTRGGPTVLGSRYPMRLDARWSPEPDLLIVRQMHTHRLTENHLDGPADMVIEIASASDPRLDEREKLPRYREAGIEEMWFINPFEQTVRVETKSKGGYSTHSLVEGHLPSTVLQGLWIDVGWLWQQPLPSPLLCLQEILAEPHGV